MSKIAEVSIGKCVDLKIGEEVLENVVVVDKDKKTSKTVTAESPVGRKIIGMKKGDTASAELPNGQVKIKVLDIKEAVS